MYDRLALLTRERASLGLIITVVRNPAYLRNFARERSEVRAIFHLIYLICAYFICFGGLTLITQIWYVRSL